MLPPFLREGYGRFRSHRYPQEKARYETLANRQQRPGVLVVACCDSRAAPETIFDAHPGELFVVRNVANIVPPYAPDGRHHATSAALEFAILALKVGHILVMGHGRCGGIAALADRTPPLSHGDFIGEWMSTLSPILDNVPHEIGQDHTDLERAGVVHSLSNLLTFPWIKERVEGGALSVHGAWFDIALGELSVYDKGDKTWRLEVGT